MQSSEEKVSFYKSNNFMRSWSKQEGLICQPEIALSANRAPPPVRGKPVEPPARTTREVAERKTATADPYLNVMLGTVRAIEMAGDAIGNFQSWLQSPPAAKPVRVKPAPTVPPFDIQEIPGAMRKLAMPVAADLMDRWFSGQLNYSPTTADENLELNQNGVPYPSSMIDTSTVKIEWVLKFSRAQRALRELLSKLGSPSAQGILRKQLLPYRKRHDIRPWLECKADIVRLHHEFQFQFVGVEASWGQKLDQLLTRSLLSEGVPDDLTGALGSFNLCAAVSYADFDQRAKSARVTHVSVYVKDNYTFTTDASKASQYLGHWNRSHVAIVPLMGISSALNAGWIDYAVTQGDVYAKDAVLYPVHNSDFRAWQRKHNQGGDFIIYTDAIRVKLDMPITVRF